MVKKLIFIFFAGLLLGSKYEPNPNTSEISIIPKPVSVNRLNGIFRLTPETTIQLPSHSAQGDSVGFLLKKKLESSTGFYNMPTATSPAKTDSNRIILQLASDTTGFGNSEGYTLQVTSQKITIKSPSPHGLFYGVQSLLQLFPPQILQSDYVLVPQNTEWMAPAVNIKDYPRFSYRGMHLDVGRHFRSVEFVKKYIDLMAMYKMNRFHWHLTEDQGWRIQIKKYPKLTQIGAWRDSTIIGHNNSGQYDHHRTGGFYTQEQIREIVNYAQKRFVTIIPEIEMPGHSSAALAAYPKLGCEGEDGNYHVRSRWGIFDDIYCPSEYTFNFLENVLTEVMDLFPGKYIHIGGDEAPKKAWKNSALAQKVIKREGLENENELQDYFIQRIENFLHQHGRNIMGWEEILGNNLTADAIVMSWHGNKGGIAAAQQHHKAVMAPNYTYYLNFYQANPKTEPIAQEKFNTPLKKVYEYNPIPDTLTKDQAKYIQGTEACLWGEYIGSAQKAEYMAYPRALAVAEVAWSPKDKRNWDDFWQRLQPQFRRLEILNVNAAEHYKGEEAPFETLTKAPSH